MAVALLVGCVQSRPLEDGGPFHPTVLYASADFATVGGRAVGFSSRGGDYPVRFEIRLVDGRYFDTGSDDWVCTLALTTPGPVEPDPTLLAEAEDADLVLAFQVPEDAERSGSCPTYDVERWGDLESRFLDGAWGFGVGAVDPEVRRAVRSDTVANGEDFQATVAPFLLGGGFSWDALDGEAPGGYVHNNRARATELEEGQEVIASGEPVPLEEADALVTPAPDAVWRVRYVYGVDAVFALTNAPPT